MAVTVVRHGDPSSAIVHRREDGVAIAETIEPGDLAAWVTERGNPDNRLEVEQVEVLLPHPFLERGITLVDTPGIGGLNAAHAAATLAFLPVADALVFVTDASAELTGPELEFLASAVDAGPMILVALTKIDMYPQWRRILEIDERRMRDIELGVRPYPVSAALRAAGRQLDEPVLERESGFGPFGETLLGEVAQRARAAAVERGSGEIRNALDQLREPLLVERQALERPESAARMADELAIVRGRLGALAEAGAHWSVRMDDEFASLRARVEFAFSGEVRRILRETQDEIERIDPARDWGTLSQKVQQEVAAAVRAAFLATTDGAAAIQTTVSGLLADEESAWTDDQAPLAWDATSLWQDGQAFGGALRSGLIAGFGLLAGATVGVEMLGMLGALLGTALVGPALLGAALFFGGKEVAGERRRQLTDRRQQARTFVAGFIEDVRFEVDGRLRDPVGHAPARHAGALHRSDRRAWPNLPGDGRRDRAGSRPGRRGSRPTTGRDPGRARTARWLRAPGRSAPGRHDRGGLTIGPTPADMRVGAERRRLPGWVPWPPPAGSAGCSSWPPSGS